MADSTQHIVLGFLQEAGVCLALARTHRLRLTREDQFDRPTLRLLTAHTMLPVETTPTRYEHDAPAHALLVRLLLAGGWLQPVDRALHLAPAALAWLAEPPVLQVTRLRHAWLQALDVGWRWLPPDRARLPLDPFWRRLTLAALGDLATRPPDNWLTLDDWFPSLAERGHFDPPGMTLNLPTARAALAARGRLMLHTLALALLPGLGLVETDPLAGRLRPTVEGAAWLRAALATPPPPAPDPAEALELSPPPVHLAFPPPDTPALTLTPHLHVHLAATAPASAVFDLAHFAQRLAPPTPLRYQITRATLGDGLRWGYSVPQVVYLLSRYAARPLPESVLDPLHAWGADLVRFTHTPGYRLTPTHPAILDALADRPPFRQRVQLLADRHSVWVSQTHAPALFRYLRRQGYRLIPTDDPHAGPSLTLHSPALPIRRLLVLMRTYAHLRHLVPGLADLGLADLDTALAGALTPDDEAAIHRLVASHHALLGQRLPPPDLSPAPASDSPLPLGEGPGVRAAPAEAPASDPPLPLGEGPGVRAVLEQAVAAQAPIHLVYVDTQARVTRRVVQPLRLVTRQGREYLVARCGLRQAERAFRLDRILTVEEQGPGRKD